jgi:sec-independent protein translocase protein TatA
MLGRIGPLELGIIVLIVLIIFGAGKLPQVGGAIGKSIREFRRAKEGTEEDTRTGSSKSGSETAGATRTKSRDE